MQTVCLRHRRGVIGDRVWKKFGPRRKRESEPSQSKPAALPALPKGELLDGVRNLTAPKKLSPWERWHCGAMTERVRTLAGGEPSQSKPSGFASSPKGRALRRSEKPHSTEKTSPLGRGGIAKQ